MAVHPADIVKPSARHRHGVGAVVLDRDEGLVATVQGLVPAGRVRQGHTVWTGARWARVLRTETGTAQPGIAIVTRFGVRLPTDPSQLVLLRIGSQRTQDLMRGDQFVCRPIPLSGTADPDGVRAVALAGLIACRVPYTRSYRAQPHLAEALARVRQSWERVLNDHTGMKLVRKSDVVVLKVKPETGTALVQALVPANPRIPATEQVGKMGQSAVALFLTHLLALAGEISGYWLRIRMRGRSEVSILQQLLAAFGIPAEVRAVSEVTWELRIAWYYAGPLESLFRYDPWLYGWISHWRRHARYDYRCPDGWVEGQSEWTDSVAMLQPCLLRPVYLEVMGGRVVCNGLTLLAGEEEEDDRNR